MVQIHNLYIRFHHGFQICQIKTNRMTDWFYTLVLLLVILERITPRHSDYFLIKNH